MKTALGETQTLRASCTKAEPKNFAPPQTPFPGAQDGQNLVSHVEMVTTFTYRPGLVKIDADNASYRGNKPTNKHTNSQTHKHTDRNDYNTLRR